MNSIAICHSPHRQRRAPRSTLSHPLGLMRDTPRQSAPGFAVSLRAAGNDHDTTTNPYNPYNPDNPDNLNTTSNNPINERGARASKLGADLEGVVLLLPEDGAEHDALDEGLHHALPHELAVLAQHAHVPHEVQPEQLQHRGPELRRVRRLVQDVRLRVLPQRARVLEARDDVAVAEVRALPPRRHLDAVWRKVPELRVLLVVHLGVVGADVDEEVCKVDVWRAVEAELV
eukprot:947741-Rhodomonas_salina.1